MKVFQASGSSFQGNVRHRHCWCFESRLLSGKAFLYPRRGLHGEIYRTGVFPPQLSLDSCSSQAPESEITVGVLKNREERQRLTTRAPSNLPPFKDILKHVDMETMSLDEQSVVMECNRVAFWKFSLPCMSGSTGLAWLLFKQGLLQGRPSASFPRLPKLFLAALVGYTGGQVG